MLALLFVNVLVHYTLKKDNNGSNDSIAKDDNNGVTAKDDKYYKELNQLSITSEGSLILYQVSIRIIHWNTETE